MNLSNIKKIADILAAAGVLISLLYLGIQVADNNKFLRSQAHYNALELNINPMVAVISDDEALPEAFWEGADAYYSNELENTQGFGLFWEKYESAFAEPFKSHVLEIF